MKIKAVERCFKTDLFIAILKLLERYLQPLLSLEVFLGVCFERPWKISCWKTKHVLQLAEQDLKRKLC